MHNARKCKRILHVNMLRQWHTPVATSFFAEGAEDEDEEDNDFPEWRPSGAKEPQLGEQLTVAQRKELATLLENFQNVLHNRPGRTTLIEHQITSGDVVLHLQHTLLHIPIVSSALLCQLPLKPLAIFQKHLHDRGEVCSSSQRRAPCWRALRMTIPCSGVVCTHLIVCT